MTRNDSMFYAREDETLRLTCGLLCTLKDNELVDEDDDNDDGNNED